MADYKNIKGFNIQYLDSDPPNPIEGQMWFNSTTQTLKGAEVAGVPVGTWSSGGTMNTARLGNATIGISTAALTSGGESPSFGYTGLTESYDGTSWTEVSDLNVVRRYVGGFGSQTSGLAVGGAVPPGNTGTNSVEEWNGSAWTTDTSIIETRRLVSTAQKGTTTAGLIFAGSPNGVVGSIFTESWNGTSWTEVNDLNAKREGGSSVGTQGSAQFATGLSYTPAPIGAVANNELWDGTSWTETTEINTARNYVFSGGSSSSDGLVFGGEVPPISALTEYWNGTSWTEVNDLSTARYSVGTGGGSTTSALVAGGYTTPGAVATTEEWIVPDSVTKTFTTS